jgi:Tol biopolymer transport system component
VKDIAEDNYYSYRDGKVVYTAFNTDARWGWKTYSVLKIWDTRVNEVKKISSKTRLFQPDISPDATTVVAVNARTDQQTNLRVIQLNDSGVVYTYPRFSADASSVISAVRNAKGEMTLLQTNLSSKQEEVLFPFSNAILSYVQVAGDTVLFTSSQKGTDVLYLYDVKSKKLFRAADMPNGNYQASLDTKSQTIIWNTFTADGNMLLKQKLSEAKLVEVFLR